MKKLLLDVCTKTAFTFNGVMYEQKDGVCIESSLSPLLANAIMTDLEEKVIKPLINDNTTKFYARYVDDTLFVIKREDVGRMQNLLIKFNPNLRFTLDLFQNEVPHFLDLELYPDGISIFRKNTNTGFSSYVCWTHRTAWIKSLTSRASRICSPNKLSSEINVIKKLASWNGFPIFVSKRLFIKCLTQLVMLNHLGY